MGPTERLALSWGNARQFTKLLLSLLSHIGKNGGLPRNRTEFSPVKSRDFTIKVCNPGAIRKDREREGGVEPPQSGL